nr:MAG TPA: DNA pilot protein VP2 [Microviridae sp.]
MPIAPLIGSALISGGASLLGNLFGGLSSGSAQRSANETNLQIAQMNNQRQYQMFQEQNAFNERMYNQMQQYNTPTAQMQRYADAGINPYIAAGNVQTGNVQSALQSAPAPQMQAAQMQPVTGPGDAMMNAGNQISSIVNQYAQNALALAQAKKTNAEANWVDRLNSANVLKLNSSSRLDEGQNALLGLDYQLKSDTLGNYIKLSDLSVINAEKTNEQLDVITQSARLENALKNIDLGIQSHYGEQMFKANLAKTLAEAFATNASVRQRDAQIAIDRQNANTNAKNAETNRMNARTNAAVGVAQIRGIIAGAIKTAEETSGIRIDNSNKQRIIDLTIEGLGLDNIGKSNNNRAFWWNFGVDNLEKLSRIGVNGSQIYYNLGAGSEKWTKAASPGHYLFGW